MKKLFSVLVTVLLLTACNQEKTYMKDLAGNWQVYKYVVHGGDKTSLFREYRITFTDNGRFIELPDTNDLSQAITGSYFFKNSVTKIALVDTTAVLVDTVYVTTTRERDFTIFNLTSNHVQFRTDTSEIYMNKIP